MGSLNHASVPVVAKSALSIRRYGSATAISSGTNPYGASSTDLPLTMDVPTIMSSGTLGTEATATVESFIQLGNAVKHANSVIDDTIALHIGL